jgi:hypothetical protein
MTMPLYRTIPFLHVISAMALFTSLAFKWTILSLLTARNGLRSLVISECPAVVTALRRS